ncbi:hypothetical protein GS966_15970 [Rhodococcus hoagii]|nr:hypothetical protein [Prescottella equi]
MTTTPEPTAGTAQPTVLDLLQASPVGPVLDMPVPRTPMEALAASPLGPALNTPFVDIAAGALPPAPALPPLPELPPLPPLPGIDQLLQPVADLASAFGTGAFGGFDPTALLRQSSSVIETALSMGVSGLRALDGAWDGSAALAAQSQGEQVRITGEQLSERGNAIASVTQDAAATVSRGNAQLVAVAESFAATAVAAAPVALTPPGQTMLLAAAADHLQRALSVVAATRAELAGHQSAMAALGAEIPVPAAPAPAAGLLAAGGQSPVAVAGSVLESVGRSLVESSPQYGDALPPQTHAASVVPVSTREFAPTAASFGGGAGASGGAGGAGGGFVPGFVAGSAGTWAGSTERGPSAAQPSVATPATTTHAEGGTRTPGAGTPAPGYAPTGTGAQPRGAYDDTVHRGNAGYLAAAVPGDEVVGELPMVAPAVIGSVEIDTLGGFEDSSIDGRAH